MEWAKIRKNSRRQHPEQNNHRRTTGLSIVALLFFSAVTAILMAHYHYFTAVLPLFSSGTLASLLLAWHSSRPGKRTTAEGISEPDLGKFARAVQKQWEDILPGPKFELSWKPASTSMAASQGASRQTGRRPRPGRQSLEAREKDLTGNLLDILRQAPGHRLVVLGEAGAGKTTLMIELLLILLKGLKTADNSQQPNDPIPVLVFMKDWKPPAGSEDGTPLRIWLAEQLSANYLGFPVETFLDKGQIMPILDGLDEMPDHLRVAAITQLNHERGLPSWIMTCRTEEYQDTVGRPGENRNLPDGAATVELQPLTHASIENHLTRRREENRWRKVLDALKHSPSSSVSEVLRSPLYASLALSIYSPEQRTEEKVPDPEEMAGPGFQTPDSLRDHLLRDYVPSSYQGSAHGRVPTFSPASAERWLRFLASYLHEENTDSLRWWDLDGIAPRCLMPLAVGLLCGAGAAALVGAKAYFGSTHGIGFGAGLLAASAVVLACMYVPRAWGRPPGSRPAERSPLPIIGGVAGAVAGAIVAGIAAKFGVGHESLAGGMPAGIGIGIGTGLSARRPESGFAAALVGSFVSGIIPGDYLQSAAAGTVSVLINGVGVGLTSGLAIDYRGRRAPAKPRGTWKPVYGVSGGAGIGLAIGLLTWTQAGAAVALAAGLFTGMLAAYPIGLRDASEDLRYISNPVEAFKRDVRAFRHATFSAGFAAGTAGTVGGCLSSILLPTGRADPFIIISSGIATGLVSGIVIGLIYGFYHSASPKFFIINGCLALRGKLPWRLRTFLNDAMERGVLRNMGADYQFRHKLLQDFLATSPPKKQAAARSPSATVGD